MQRRDRLRLTVEVAALVVAGIALFYACQASARSEKTAAEQLDLDKKVAAASGPVPVTTWSFASSSTSKQVFSTDANEPQMPLVAWRHGDVWVKLKIQNEGQLPAEVSGFGVGAADWATWITGQDLRCKRGPQAQGGPCREAESVPAGGALFVGMHIPTAGIQAMSDEQRSSGLTLFYDAGSLPQHWTHTWVTVPARSKLGW
jgi:hypothetical protein